MFVFECPTKEDLLNSEVVCSKCAKSFPHSSALRLHTVKRHRDITSDRDRRLFHGRSASKYPLGDEEIRFLCPAEGCKYKGVREADSFGSYKLLKQHYWKVHTEKRLLCRKCGELNFSLERDRTYHEKSCRGAAVPCPIREVAIDGSASIDSVMDCAILNSQAREENTTSLNEPEQTQAVVSIMLVTAMMPSTSFPADSAPPRPKYRRLAPKMDATLVCRDEWTQTNAEHVAEQMELQQQQQRLTSSQSIQCGRSRLALEEDVATAAEAVRYLEAAAQVSFETFHADMLNASSSTDMGAADPFVSGQDFFCQTSFPPLVDASVSADLSAFGRHWPAPVPASLDLDPTIFSTIETQTEEGEQDEFDEFLRHCETQTQGGGLPADIQTQTSLIDFIDSGFTTAETQTG